MTIESTCKGPELDGIIEKYNIKLVDDLSRQNTDDAAKKKRWRRIAFALTTAIKVGLLALSFTYQAVEGFDLAKEVVLKIFGITEGGLVASNSMIIITVVIGVAFIISEIVSYFGFEYSKRKAELGWKDKPSDRAQFIQKGMLVLEKLCDKVEGINEHRNRYSDEGKAQATAELNNLQADIALLEHSLEANLKIVEQKLNSTKTKIIAGVLVAIAALVELGGTGYFAFGFGLLIASMTGVAPPIGFAIAGILAIIFVAAKAYQFKQLTATELRSVIERKICGLDRKEHASNVELHTRLLQTHKEIMRDHNCNDDSLCKKVSAAVPADTSVIESSLDTPTTKPSFLCPEPNS